MRFLSGGVWIFMKKSIRPPVPRALFIAIWSRRAWPYLQRSEKPRINPKLGRELMENGGAGLGPRMQGLANKVITR